jgi:molecular chaperone GrpE
MSEEQPPTETDESSPTASATPLNKAEQLEMELKECKDKHLRALAEMENSRKRMVKEKQESVRFALENTFAELLSPMDNLEMPWPLPTRCRKRRATGRLDFR